LFPTLFFAQSKEKFCATLSKVNTLIQSNHYKPKAIDDSLSVYVFNTLFEKLDDNNRLFLKSEMDVLKKHQYQIDNYIKDNDCTFLEEIYKIYKNGIVRNHKLYEQVEKEMSSVESDETILFSKTAFPYVATENDLKKRIKKSVQFQILKNIAELSKNKDSLAQHLPKLSIESKKKIFDLIRCKTAELNFSSEEFNAEFLDIFCSYFDPHTSYFSSDDKTNFLSSVSSDNFSFGLILSLNDNDEIIIENIVPGSSAYFADGIEKGDQIISIKTTQEFIEISCSTKQKVETVFNSTDIQKADFNFRKKSGENYKVSLEKKKLTNYNTSLYSFILKKGKKKIGYIKIPSFYGEVGSGQTTVSKDFAKEIYKLQKDNIDGLIVDVQNNGGGSMYEAIHLTGMFIDIGPVAILNDQKNKVETVRDPNRGSIYNGPLVVLVNAYSASASEFFANAIQDYDRGLIVGNTTRGKASMQTILPINTEQNDAVKITIEAFYRVTGKSNQGIGIFPDVEIPSLFNNQMEREHEEPNALKNDEVIPKMRFTLFNNPKKNEAILKSKARIKISDDVSKIVALNVKIDAAFDPKFEPILLNFNTVFKEVEKTNTLWKEIKTQIEVSYPIEVEQSKEEIEYQQFDEFIKSSNIEKIKAIKNNLHIFESINIIDDLTP
jgi:carboxyl-terminal processing protease